MSAIDAVPAGVGRRWGPAALVAAAVVAFLAGLPLVELATTPEPSRTPTELPWNQHSSTSSVGGVTIEPAAGWAVTASVYGMPGLHDGAATFAVGFRDGVSCPAAEAAAVSDLRDDEPAVPETGRPYRAGSTSGTLRTWWGASSEGLAFTTCQQGTAVTVVARGPVGSLSGDGYDDVAAMLDSLELR